MATFPIFFPIFDIIVACVLIDKKYLGRIFREAADGYLSDFFSNF
nr:MAG TPA: hypothetical protein [Microviridae sp.]